MELIRGLHNLRDRHRGCALAIGNFDGLHRAHQELLHRAQVQAQRLGVPSAVMIFEPMPREYFLPPQQAPQRISEFRDKLRRFQRAGMDQVICLRFDDCVAHMGKDQFVDELICERIDARAVVVGFDFRFGVRREGEVTELRHKLEARGKVLEVLDAIMLRGVRCSSSAIREALTVPQLGAVAEFLGRPYSMIGRIRHGLKLGRKLGMPTANIHLHRRPALRLGIYAVVANLAAGGAQRWPGVASLGVRPTIGGTRPLLETHFFDNADDWYGREVEIEFVQHLRDEAKFDTLEALAAQMQRDADQARALLT